MPKALLQPVLNIFFSTLVFSFCDDLLFFVVCWFFVVQSALESFQSLSNADCRILSDKKWSKSAQVWPYRAKRILIPNCIRLSLSQFWSSLSMKQHLEVFQLWPILYIYTALFRESQQVSTMRLKSPVSYFTSSTHSLPLNWAGVSIRAANLHKYYRIQFRMNNQSVNMSQRVNREKDI